MNLEKCGDPTQDCVPYYEGTMWVELAGIANFCHLPAAAVTWPGWRCLHFCLLPFWVTTLSVNDEPSQKYLGQHQTFRSIESKKSCCLPIFPRRRPFNWQYELRKRLRSSVDEIWKEKVGGKKNSSNICKSLLLQKMRMGDWLRIAEPRLCTFD